MLLHLELTLFIELYLDPQNETQQPYAHAYLSNHVSTKVHLVRFQEEWELKRIAADRRTWEFKVKLDFPVEFSKLARRKLEFYRGRPLAEEDEDVALKHALIETTNLNLDVWSHITSNYGDQTSNKAGRFVVPLAYGCVRSRLRTKADLLTMPHVYQPNARTKGTYRVTFDAVALNETIPLSDSLDTEQLNQILERNKNRTEFVQHIVRLFIKAGQTLFNSIEETHPGMKNINSDVWTSRYGDFPALAYCMDVTKPDHEERYYINALNIVLARSRLSREQFAALNIRDKSHARILGSVCSQLLCLFTLHCAYRSDIAFIHDTLTKAFRKVGTEDFGDTDVDSLTDELCASPGSDCEDFTKNIVRHKACIEYHEFQSDACMQLVKRFLSCYYPVFMLLGVAGKQIHKQQQQKDEDMDAHENAGLIPKALFFQMLSRDKNLDMTDFKERLFKLYPEERVHYENSLELPVMILEGTGPLWPLPSTDAEADADFFYSLDMSMGRDVYLAMKRWRHFIPGKNTEFFKAVIKIFCPDFVRMGFGFGTFIVCRLDPLTGKLTKGVMFSEFTLAVASSSTTQSSSIVLLSELELTPEEKMAIRIGMTDIHPPYNQRAPQTLPPPNFAESDRLVLGELASALRKVSSLSAPPASASHTCTLSLRKSKCSTAIIRKCIQWVQNELPSKRVLYGVIYPEYVTETVGGYCMQLYFK